MHQATEKATENPTEKAPENPLSTLLSTVYITTIRIWQLFFFGISAPSHGEGPGKSHRNNLWVYFCPLYISYDNSHLTIYFFGISDKVIGLGHHAINAYLQSHSSQPDQRPYERDLDAEELFGREFDYLDERDIFDDLD